MTTPRRTIKVFLSCTGADFFQGGHETFGRECFYGLRGTPGLDIKLIKATPPFNEDERQVWCLRRDQQPAIFLSSLTKRTSYAIEANTSALPILNLIRKEQPDALLTSEANLLFRLRSLRKFFGKPVGLILSNGAPIDGPFKGLALDQIQQCTPAYYQQAIDRGDPPGLNSLVPYGFNISDSDPDTDPALKSATRHKLGLPLDRKILISVGWISAKHKRMDHLINEVARLPQDQRPFVLMLGRQDDTSPAIHTLAAEKLGQGHFQIKSVPATEVATHYIAADAFALCSLNEGFGRVFVESLAAGLPVITHNAEVMRFVVGDAGHLIDMTEPGALSNAIRLTLDKGSSPSDAAARRRSVRERFGWKALAPRYLEMFWRAHERAAQSQAQGGH